MDNKKLLKFLYKDIAEIEELVIEKGNEGFDEFEVEFIQSRFKGAKQLIQILSEKENKQLKNIRPRPIAKKVVEEEILLEPKEEVVKAAEPQVQMSVEETESLQELSNFEEELKVDVSDEIVSKVEEPVVAAVEKAELKKEDPVLEDKLNKVEPEVEKETEQEFASSEESESGVELDEEEDIDEANHRLGDSFSKENSVNELLGNDESSKLEYKISNSPVESIKTAIGINDRYQYIRELFEGSSDTFNDTVTELDKLDNIKDAVNYLQQNYKWKKNDTSLKFVNLVKRRFPNG